ncbi:MAG: His-Xaa-Ser system radical SAM maturase HxsB [Spirochaetes bacterium]|nr:His-Xaa-Ser system radical SAM maturase HxsB [Spirochaetota bacterium]
MIEIKLPKIKVNSQKVGFFRFKKSKNNRYLLTNDLGEYIILPARDFQKFVKGKIRETDPVYPILQEQGLIRDKMDFFTLISEYQKKNLFLYQGPSLHIIVVTLRCNQKCVYCQASSRGENEKGYDLDMDSAKKIVDIIFTSPSQSIAIEFQGGEPLLNWPVVEFIIKYAREKNKTENKDLEMRLVSNFSLMDEDKLGFLVNHSVTLCTSLDGPEELHNKNRIWLKGNNYKHTINWLKKAQKVYKNKLENIFRPGALVTVSRLSLKYPKEIVQEYINRGIEAIFIRPMTPLGVAKDRWERIGYSAEEYIKFYKKALSYVITYNLNNPKTRFHENFAKIILAKILTEYDPNYLELRSPCGAGIGQILYNYDGRIYTCDEGRMVGEETFCIGDVKKDRYEDIISHSTVKSLCLASCLDGLPCDSCVYKPYCGVCPIYNYATSGNIFSQMPLNDRCKIMKGTLDFIFEKIENKRIREIFVKWAKYTLPESMNKNRDR